MRSVILVTYFNSEKGNGYVEDGFGVSVPVYSSDIDDDCKVLKKGGLLM